MLFTIDESRIRESMQSSQYPGYVIKSFNMGNQCDQVIPEITLSISGTVFPNDAEEAEPAFGTNVREAVTTLRKVFGQ